MKKWEISKSFEFCYGHRVHTQVLDSKLSCNAKCKCRHQHGHQGTLIVHLEGNFLNDQGMILDFVNLNFVKKFIDDVVDHKMVFDIEDPVLPELYPKIFQRLRPSDDPELFDRTFCWNQSLQHFVIWSDVYENLSPAEIEIYEGLVFVQFVPTSENLSKWFYDIIQNKLDGIATVSKVEFYETPKSKSVYYGR